MPCLYITHFITEHYRNGKWKQVQGGEAKCHHLWRSRQQNKDWCSTQAPAKPLAWRQKRYERYQWRGQNGESTLQKKINQSHCIFAFPPALLSLGAFTREHRTIDFKPEIRTVLMKICHAAVPHMQCSCDATSRERNKCNLFVYEEGLCDALPTPSLWPTLYPPQPVSSSNHLSAHASLLSQLKLFLCGIFPSSSTPSSPPWAS